MSRNVDRKNPAASIEIKRDQHLNVTRRTTLLFHDSFLQDGNILCGVDGNRISEVRSLIRRLN